MAGFDASFRFHPDDLALLTALMAAARRRARPIGVRWRSTLDPAGRGYCMLDGNGFRLDMLLERLRRDLPTIAEATPSDRHTPAQRRRFANGLCDVLCKWRGNFYDRYYREDGPDHIPQLRRISTRGVWPVHLLWPSQAHADLYPRLEVTEEVMNSWVLDEVVAEVVIEELHTAAELMLTRLAGKRRAPAFAELVAQANQSGRLGRHLRHAYVDHDPNAINDMADLLISLKDTRKRAKHQASDEARSWLIHHFWAAGAVLEHLCVELHR